MQRGNASYELDAIIDDPVNIVVHAENAFDLTDLINCAAESPLCITTPLNVTFPPSTAMSTLRLSDLSETAASKTARARA